MVIKPLLQITKHPSGAHSISRPPTLIFEWCVDPQGCQTPGKLTWKSLKMETSGGDSKLGVSIILDIPGVNLLGVSGVYFQEETCCCFFVNDIFLEGPSELHPSEQRLVPHDTLSQKNKNSRKHWEPHSFNRRLATETVSRICMSFCLE